MTLSCLLVGLATGFPLGAGLVWWSHRRACLARLPYVECPWHPREFRVVLRPASAPTPDPAPGTFAAGCPDCGGPLAVDHGGMGDTSVCHRCKANFGWLPGHPDY